MKRAYKDVDFDKRLGLVLRELRKNKGLTLEKLNEKTGLNLTKSAWSGIENGKQQVSARQLFKIAEALNTDLQIIDDRVNGFPTRNDRDRKMFVQGLKEMVGIIDEAREKVHKLYPELLSP